MKHIRILVALALFAATTVSAAEPERFTYSVADGDSLHAFVFSPPLGGPGPPNAILLFHGGGWAAGSPEWVFGSAERFAQWGLVAIAIEFRLSQGRVTPIDAIDDACRAFAWARTNAAMLGIGKKVLGYGVSAGGHLVAAAATIRGPRDAQFRPDALLLWSPALDVTGDGWFVKLLQGRGEAADYSPAQHAGRGTPPTSIVHGRADTLTPLAGAQRFHDRVIAAGGVCELNVFDGVGHLLTRNLANQESDFDPDPDKRAEGIERHRRFLERLGFIPVRK